LGLVLRGIFSTFLALVTEQAGTVVLDALFYQGTRAYLLFDNFIVIALSEEGFKYLLLKRKTWKSPEFNCQYDGVVYATFVSLGFALWENISYVILYGFQTAVMRAVTAVPGHACFGVFMGVFYGIAKRMEREGNKFESAVFRKLALIVPILLHGTYDYIASANYSGLVFLGFVGILFAVSYKIIKGQSQKDRYI